MECKSRECAGKRLATNGDPDPTAGDDQVAVAGVAESSSRKIRAEGLWPRLALQARRVPDAVALAGAREDGRSFRITYETLERKSRALAHQLSARGVYPETPVAICMGRVPEAFVAIWAILRCGGAYAPLSAGDPVSRLTRFVREAGIGLVICDAERAKAFEEVGITVMILNPQRMREPIEDIRLPTLSVQESNLAYLVFTSGSTGSPKAVAVENGSLLRYCESLAGHLALEKGLHFALVSTLAADLGNSVIFPCFLSGGCLHLISRDTALLPASFAAYLRRNLIDFVKMVPTHVEALLQGASAAEVTPRRFLILGGEACGLGLIRAIQQGGQARVFNHYGPTEATVGVTIHEANRAMDAAQGRFLPLGRTFPHAEAYVMDRNCRPMEQQSVGELWLGGAALARGYWRKPEETAERFTPHPLSPRAGARLYRSGDLARWDERGSLVFLGRSDQQLKIRGFRVELREIERALERHHRVTRAVVVARDRGQVNQERSETYLAAYVQTSAVRKTGSREVEWEPGELWRFLAESLPSQMIPTTFMELERFPITPNGKLNRSALPKPHVWIGSSVPHPPRNEIERRLCALWETVLKARPIDIHQHFAALGGNSLSAAQLAIRIREAFRIDIKPVDLLEGATIAQIASKALALPNPQQSWKIAPLAKRVSTNKPAPLSFAQERLWFLQNADPEGSHYHVCRAFHLRGPFSVLDFQKGLALLMQRHECLRTAIRLSGDRPMQEVEPEASLSLTLVDLQGRSARNGAHLQRLVRETYIREFSLGRAPLARFLLCRLEKDQFLFMAVMHHIISDGWSMAVFLRELSSGYGASSRDEEVVLPKLESQYTAYARQQRQWLRSPEYYGQLGFWRRLLGPDLPVLSTDRTRPARPAFRKQIRAVRIPRALAQDIERFSRQMRGTPFVTLLSAFQVLLWRYSGQSLIPVGTASANRDQEGLEQLIGLFVNSLTILGDLSRNPSFREFHGRVHAAALDAQRNQDLPFEKIVEALNPRRETAINPLFQAMFLYHPRAAPFRLRGMRAEPFAMGFEKTLLDMILVLEEEPSGLEGHLVFNEEVYLSSTMDRLAASFAPLLQSLMHNADVPLYELETPP